MQSYRLKIRKFSWKLLKRGVSVSFKLHHSKHSAKALEHVVLPSQNVQSWPTFTKSFTCSLLRTCCRALIPPFLPGNETLSSVENNINLTRKSLGLQLCCPGKFGLASSCWALQGSDLCFLHIRPALPMPYIETFCQAELGLNSIQTSASATHFGPTHWTLGNHFQCYCYLIYNIKESPGSHQHQGEGSQRKLQERFNDVAITATRNRSSTTEKLVGDQVDQCDITSSVNTFKQTIDHLPSCKNSALKRRGSKVAQKVNVIGCNQKTLADAESGLSGSKLFSSQTRALSMLLIEPSTEREASQTDSVQIFEVQIQPHFWRGWYLKEKFKSIGKLHHLWSWNDSCNWYANEVQICERGRLSFAWVPSLKANDTRLQVIDLSKAKECDFMNESYMKTSNSKHWINQETTAVCLRWAYSSSRWPTDRHHCASKGTKQTSNSSHSCCTSARPGRCSSRRVQILGQEWQGTVTQRWETQNQNHCGFNWLNTNGQEAAGIIEKLSHCCKPTVRRTQTIVLNDIEQPLATSSTICSQAELHDLRITGQVGSLVQNHVRIGHQLLYLIYSFRISVWHISDIETWLTGPIFLKPDAPWACWLNVRFHFLCLRLQIECSEISMQPRYFHDIFGPVDLHLTTFNFKVWNSRHLSCSASAFSCSYRNSNIAIPMLSSWC